VFQDEWRILMGSNFIIYLKVIFIIVVTAFYASPLIAKPQYAAIVMEYPSNIILINENSQILNQPASLAKVMTLYLVFQALDSGRLKMNQSLHVSKRAADRQPSKLGLKPNQTITLEEAICGLVTKSANDAATVIAESMAADEDEFAKHMTEQAHKLGMKNTTFMNASGIANDKQLTTAADMATLGAAMIRDFPHYYHYFALKEFHFHGGHFKNHNHLLVKYQGCDGIKTGYTNASGFNLLSSATRGGHRLIAVVLGGHSIKGRDLRVMQLLDSGFTKLAQLNNSGKASATTNSTSIDKIAPTTTTTINSNPLFVFPSSIEAEY
jgi:D-alanyl-D-alanine carboxypeptidase